MLFLMLILVAPIFLILFRYQYLSVGMFVHTVRAGFDNKDRPYISISQALLRTLSRQSSRRLVVFGRLFNGVIHCCSVAIPLACICICCKLYWGLSYNMGVRSGVCIALGLLLLMRLVLHYNG